MVRILRWVFRTFVLPALLASIAAYIMGDKAKEKAKRSQAARMGQRRRRPSRKSSRKAATGRHKVMAR